RPAGAVGHWPVAGPRGGGVGVGRPVQDLAGVMVVGIGGGTTEVAIISFGGIVTGTSIRVGGDELDQAVIQYVKKKHSMALGERSAEALKMAIGSASSVVDGETTQIKGRDLGTGLPKAIRVSGQEIREAIEEP